MSSPCAADCASQHYPPFPYEDGAESLFAKALPIMLSAMVVVISWLAGRFIDKIEVSAPGGIARSKSGNFGTLKRCPSNDKDFHSSRGAMSTSVQELDGLSLADDEGRLYNETYGSEHSRDDGDRYDALGDSPGAQGPSSQGPRSPSVYSHFSQSVFSQSAYGPSAYGPSQRRPSGTGMLGVPGSQVGSSAYDVTSSHAGSGGSQYAGPVPSNLGASQLSEGQASFNGGPGGVVYGTAHLHGPYATRLGSGPLGSGPLGGFGGGSGGQSLSGGSGPVGRGSGSIAAPPYNPNAIPVVASRGLNGMSMSAGIGLGVPVGAGTMRGGGGGGTMYPGSGRGSPPPYAHAQAQMLAPASVLPREPRPSVESYTQPGNQDENQGRSGTWRNAVVAGAVGESGMGPSGIDAGAASRHASLEGRRSDLKVQAPPARTGPRSGFGSDSEFDGGLGTPSTFRA